jgi:hypothetical protein
LLAVLALGFVCSGRKRQKTVREIYEPFYDLLSPRMIDIQPSLQWALTFLQLMRC